MATINNITSVWSNAAVTYTGVGLNVTTFDSIYGPSYAPESRLLNLRVNGNSVFSIDSNGSIYTTSPLFTPSANANVNVDLSSVLSRSNAIYNFANGIFDLLNSAFTRANTAYLSSNDNNTFATSEISTIYLQIANASNALALTQRIDSLSASVNTNNSWANASITELRLAVATANSALTTRLDNLVSSVNTQNTQIYSTIDSLKLTLANSSNVFALSLAVDELNSRVNTQNSQTNARINSLSQTVATTNTALALRLETLSSLVNTQNSQSTARINSLSQTLATVNTALALQVSNLNSLVTTQNTQIYSSIDSLRQTFADSSNTFSLSLRVDGLSSLVNTQNSQANARISSLAQTVATSNTALSLRVDELNSRVNTQNSQTNARITSSLQTLANSDNAIATRIDGLSTFMNTANSQTNSRIDTTIQAISSGDSALTLRLDNFGSFVNTQNSRTNSRITTLDQTFNTANTSLAQRMSSLESTTTNTLGVFNSQLNQINQTLSTSDSSQATRLNNLSASYGINSNSAGILANAQAYLVTSGQMTNSNFVNGLYPIVFRRTADSTGATFWTNLLNNNTLTREQVFSYFFASPEYQNTYGNPNTNPIGAALTSLAQTTANANSAIVSRVNSLTTTVGGFSSSIAQATQATADIQGNLGLSWSLIGTLNQQTGGLTFTGVKKADGSGATYNLDINSNVNIRGNLIVDGTITTSELGNESATITRSTSSVTAPGAGTSFTTFPVDGSSFTQYAPNTNAGGYVTGKATYGYVFSNNRYNAIPLSDSRNTIGFQNPAALFKVNEDVTGAFNTEIASLTFTLPVAAPCIIIASVRNWYGFGPTPHWQWLRIRTSAGTELTRSFTGGDAQLLIPTVVLQTSLTLPAGSNTVKIFSKHPAIQGVSEPTISVFAGLR